MSKSITDHTVPPSLCPCHILAFQIHPHAPPTAPGTAPPTSQWEIATQGLLDGIHLPKKQSLAAILKYNPATIIKIDETK